MSSRNMLPVCASSKRPFFSLSALVYAPFACPNSSVSRRSGGSAASPTLTKGLEERMLVWCIYSATSSLPTPVSPISRTDESDAEMVSMREMIVRIASLCVMSDIE